MSIGELAMLVNDNFDKPINEQLKDMFGLLANENQIFDIKDLGTNDFGNGVRILYENVPTDADKDLVGKTTVKTPKKIYIDAQGTILLKSSITFAGGKVGWETRNLKLYCRLYKNGELYNEQLLYPFSYEDPQNFVVSSEIISITIPIDRGDEIYMEYDLTMQSSSTDISNNYFVIYSMKHTSHIYASPVAIGINKIGVIE